MNDDIDYQLFYNYIIRIEEQLGQRLKDMDYLTDYPEIKALGACYELQDYLANLMANRTR